MITALLLIAGFFLLTLGAELLVRGASWLAESVGVSSVVVGLTVVAYGTSAPELAVAIQSLYEENPQPGIALGNVVGSNISNILLVLGIAAMVCPIVVSREFIRQSVPFMILVTGLTYYLASDGLISNQEGYALMAIAVGYSSFAVLRSRQQEARRKLAEQSEPEPKNWFRFLYNAVFLLAGLILLIIGARMLVHAAVSIATVLNVSELVIGLTIIAVGTSLPEIATSLLSAFRGKSDLAIGNVVGSNIFNLLLVLGACAAFSPSGVEVLEPAMRFDFPVMMATTVACFPVFFSGSTITRFEGLVFFGYYVAYTAYLFLQSKEQSGLEAFETAMIYFVIPLTAIALLFSFTQALRRHYRQPDPPADSHD